MINILKKNFKGWPEDLLKKIKRGGDILGLVLLSAHVQIFIVCRMWDFFGDFTPTDFTYLLTKVFLRMIFKKIQFHSRTPYEIIN